MSRTISSRKLLAIVVLGAILVSLALPALVYALPQYASATGQPCSTCHVNPAGGGPRNDLGQRFEAVPNHASDPLAAYQQALQAAQPTAAPTEPPAAQPTPAPAQPTAAPAQPTAAPAQPTVAPVQPTAAPAQPTPTPGALPRTGGLPLEMVALGAVTLVAAGLSLRRISR